MVIENLEKQEIESFDSCVFARLLGDTLRPGGLKLTARAAALADIKPNQFVLDIGCGKGVTAIFLAQKYACYVAGIDLSEKMIFSSRIRAGKENIGTGVSLVIGDGENLPFGEASFDLVIMESVFSLLPNKKEAATEINRVLKPRGKWVISDVTLRGEVSNELQNQITFPCCLAGAWRTEKYVDLFKQTGYSLDYLEDWSGELEEIWFQLGTAFGDFEQFVGRLPAGPCQQKYKKVASNGAEAWADFIRLGRPGYLLMSMTKT